MKGDIMETFFQTHAFLMEHFNAPIRRSLMDSIDWSYRMIAIRGPRGVGRTSFLLQFAKEKFDVRLRKCLYINMNNFYFQGRGIVEFAGEFVANGGLVLLIDQAFKLTQWRQQLCECYHRYPHLRIVYTTTSVEDSEDENSELSSLSRCYVLHGFSFREYINLQTGNNFPTYTISDILNNHEAILKTILPKVRPWHHFMDYLNHGYYPFFLENHNFTEALLKAMNMMLEIDVLFNKQVELKYLSRIKKLLYLLAIGETSSPNISKLAEEIGTSRATVMNYLKYLEEARLINMVYHNGESFPKKPAVVMMHNTNLLNAVGATDMSQQMIMETFLVNTLWRHHKITKDGRDRREGLFHVDNSLDICVCDKNKRVKANSNTIYVRYNTEIGHGKDIPLWLFGFLY